MGYYGTTAPWSHNPDFRILQKPDRRSSDTCCRMVETVRAFAACPDLISALRLSIRRYQLLARTILKKSGSTTGAAFWLECADDAARASQILSMFRSETAAVPTLQRSGLAWIAEAIVRGRSAWPEIFGDW